MITKNKLWTRTILAFVLSPYISSMIYILLGFGFVFSELENLFAFTHLTVSYVYPASIVIGLPGYFVLRKLNLLNIYFFALLIGSGGFVLSHFVTLGGYRESGDLSADARAFVAGSIGAVLFWAIINRTREEQDQGHT